MTADTIYAPHACKLAVAASALLIHTPCMHTGAIVFLRLLRDTMVIITIISMMAIRTRA